MFIRAAKIATDAAPNVKFVYIGLPQYPVYGVAMERLARDIGLNNSVRVMWCGGYHMSTVLTLW